MSETISNEEYDIGYATGYKLGRDRGYTRGYTKGRSEAIDECVNFVAQYDTVIAEWLKELKDKNK